jgi:murein L,D-transpeptidase YcbB/YkuD
MATALWTVSCAPERKPEVQAPPPLKIESEIGAIVTTRGEDLGLADTVGFDRTWGWLEPLYREHRNHPYWSHGSRLRREAKDLLETLRRVESLGLDPADYELEHLERLAAQSERGNPPAEHMRPRILARFDVTATWAVLRIAEQLRAGRVPRRWLDPDWVVDSLTPRRVDALAHSLGHDPWKVLATLEQGHPGYLRLRDALARYRAIAADGGWAPIPPGPPLKKGDRGPRVARLIRRLAWTDDYRLGAGDSLFDARLEAAVGAVQARMGIPVSGMVGEATREALNVPVGQRIRQIELNLERWRWLPDSLGARRVEVNLPAYRLDLYRDGRIVRAMRVVVGKRKSPTPVFSDRIAYLELNPTWTMPPSVVQKEIAPAIRRNRDYLQINHIHVYSLTSATRDTLDPRKVPWKDASTDSFPYLLIQDAGPDNPLGQIKLMCPNEYDVYLHDTPARSRFSVAVRDYSHGCVRVEHAVELADSLLGASPRDSVRLDSLIAMGSWRRVRLSAQVPVHFLYWTAWVDSVGRMNYREDLYGLDQRLDAALRSRTSHDLDPNPGVALSPLWLAAESRTREQRAKLEAARAIRRKKP